MATKYSLSIPTEEEEIHLLGSVLSSAINLTNMELLLPEELLFEIFAKLPTKSVGKCRCLSKHWSFALSTPHFINKHLSIRQKQQLNLILVDKKRSFLVINSPTVKQQESRKDLSYELASYGFFFGSCNGLLLLVNEKEKLLLVNPTTLKQVQLPDMAKIDYDLVPDEWSRALVTYGLGYDCVSDEYKVVAICFYMNYFRPIRETFVQVYSFKKGGFWKVLKDSGGYGDIIPTRKCGVFANGALHWSTGVDLPNSRPLMATFDLASETFRVIEFPAEVNKRKMYNEVMVLGGCLCMVDDNKGGFADLWMMKEYGVESWTKVRICAGGLWQWIKLLCIAGDGEVLGVSNRDKWCLCDMTKGTCKEVVVDGTLKAPYCEGGAFVDSLVDPRKLVEEVVG